jgi:hypothetical protein
MGTQGGAPAIAFWNTWFENQANGNRVEELESGKSYSFVLDISRFSYFEKYAAIVGPSVQKAVSDAFEHHDKKVWFTIRPILHGDLLGLAKSQLPSEVLEIDIDKLVKPKDKSVEEKINLKYDDFLKGKLKLRDFSREEHAGQVTFKMQANRPGDATISVSIWDERGMIPLDHLTVSVRVKGKGSQVARPRPARNTVPLRAGQSTLLDVSSDFSSAGSLVADAAFYIFEPGPRDKSVILFAAKKVRADAGVPGQEQGVDVYAWETKSLLSQYVGDQNQFLVKIKEARQRATDLDKRKQGYSYQAAADELRKKIFSGFDARDQRQATKAERIFSDLVRLRKQSSVVFVRMRNEEGVPVYLPLGILAARSQKPFLDKRIILVQPLPRERYPANVHPVEAWTFSVPQELGELTSQTNEALKQLKTSTSSRFYRDIPDFRGFLETVAPRVQESKPEGILLLAHQAGGNLWSTDKSNRIIVEDIKHRFPRGSVAILSACSTAAAEGNNQAILEKLNDNGIDAMIISPFPVEANYGAMLAIHFVEALEEAKAGPKGLTMIELFEKSAEKTARHFKEVMNINFEEMALEFLIAGDYRISVAPK